MSVEISLLEPELLKTSAATVKLKEHTEKFRVMHFLHMKSLKCRYQMASLTAPSHLQSGDKFPVK